MQKFVVKKSKSAPLAPTSTSQPLQVKPTLSANEKTVPQNASTAKQNSVEATAVPKSDVTMKQPAAEKQTPPSCVKMSGYLKKKRNVRAKSR